MTKSVERLRWPVRVLGEFLTVLTDYHANGSYEKLKEHVQLLDEPDHAVMIRTTNFENADFTEDLKFISKDAYEYLAKSKVFAGDILMNKIANAGSVYRMPDLRRPVSLAMNLFLLRTNSKLLDQRFAYYYLKANESYIKSFANGAATQTITKDAVRNLEIKVPPMSVQIRIGEVLSTFEDLVEIDQRRIRALESMARSFYREWMRSSESSDGHLGDVCDITKNGFIEDLHSELPLLDLARIPSRFLAPRTTGNASELKTSRILFERGDTLFGAIRCYLHKVVIAPFRGVTNVSVFVLRPKRENLRSFLALVASSPDTVRWADQHSSGTKMPVINWSVLKSMPLRIPTDNHLARFEHIVRPLIDQLCILSVRGQLLQKTRDLLLPRLTGGDISIPRVEILEQEAVAETV